MREKPFQGLSERTVHLCIDMQNLFGPGSPWETPWFERVLHQVVRLVESHPRATAFTRFVPPLRAEDMPGTWQVFYRRWNALTREHIELRLLELAAPLARYDSLAPTFDRQFYSAFANPQLARWLRERAVDTLVISGTETDVCVLCTVLDAVDLGFRVVLSRGALCSASDETHDALMKLYRERFSHHIEVADVSTILEAWA